jgi:hypothetical protein
LRRSLKPPQALDTLEVDEMSVARDGGAAPVDRDAQVRIAAG